MYLWVHTDASYIPEPKAILQTGGYHYFSNKTKLTIQYDDPIPKHNHPAHVLSRVIGALMSSTQECETGGSYINAKEALPMLQMTIRMGHPHGPTPLKLDNKCAHGILPGVLKKNLKVWTRDSTGFVIDS